MSRILRSVRLALEPLATVFKGPHGVVVLGFALLAALWATDVRAEGRAVFATPENGAIHISADVTLALTPKGARWWISGGGDRDRLASAEGAAALRELLGGLHTVRALGRHGRVTAGAFDHPVVIRWGGQRVEYGGASRIPGLVYLRLPDGNIHLGRPLPELPSPSELVDRRLFPDGLFAVDSINVEGPRGLLHVTQKFGVWRITVPEPAAADGAVVDAWLARLSTLRGDPLADNPSMKGAVLVTLSGAGGRVLSVGLRGDGRVAMGGDVYRIDLPVDSQKPLGQVPVPLVPERFRWMDKQILNLVAAEVTGLQVREGEVARRFSLGDKGKWVERGTGKVYRSWVSDLFALLAPLNAIGLWEGDKAVLGEAQREVRLWHEDAVLASIELWRDGDKRWWVRAGESIAVFEIDSDLAIHVGRLF